MTEQMNRCEWCGEDPLYIRYHDEEWGRPVHDGKALFEALMLEGFQAGLSWITILRKRENFRAAFDGFEPKIIAQYDEAKINALLQDAGIIRHKGKIEATIGGARAWLEIEAGEGFSDFIWGFVDGTPIINHPKQMSDIPTTSPIAIALSKELKKRGFKFCGPSITYAFMQAVGMVDDHQIDCHAKGSKQAGAPGPANTPDIGR